jgi:hypothetical protein
MNQPSLGILLAILLGSLAINHSHAGENSQKLQDLREAHFKQIGILFDGGSLVLSFATDKTEMLDIILRSFAGDHTGTRIRSPKQPGGIRGTWIEYIFYNKNESYKFKQCTIARQGEKDEQKLMAVINDASRELTIAQQEYLRIFARVIKTRDDTLRGLLLELPYRQVFTAGQCS